MPVRVYFKDLPVLTDGTCVKWGARSFLNPLAGVLLAAVFVPMSAPASISRSVCVAELSWCIPKLKQVSSRILTQFNGNTTGLVRLLKTAVLQKGNSLLPQNPKQTKSTHCI